MAEYNLTTEIKFLKGVGEKRAKLFSESLSINTISDLLFYFPYKHIDRSVLFKISEIPVTGAFVQFKGKFIDFKTSIAGNRRLLTAKVSDGSATIEVVWFAGHSWIQNTYKVGVEYLFFGKPNVFNRKINFVHPEIEPIENYFTKHNYTFSPVYSIPEKLKKSNISSKTIQSLVEQALEITFVQIRDFYTPDFCKKHNLIPLQDALKNIHFPSSHEILINAERRLKFDELFLLQLDLLRQFKLRKANIDGIRMPVVGNFFNTFYKQNLPFELTGAQKRVVREIFENIKSGEQMNRLLQGDVGSGKTLVALLAALLCADNGYQTCFMAPTEILAKQHFASISKFVSGLGFNVDLLTGSTKKKDRKIIHEKLADGTTHLLIGTHALIEDIVTFDNLGMVIVDEQHRFGVAQRAKLWKKGRQIPHVLVVTATPIPRTLALTLYGDLDISIIDEMPPGRKPIKTVHYYNTKRKKLYEFMKEQIDVGRQVYIVFPLIEESESFDYENLEEGYERTVAYFGKENVVMVHGKMKADEKNAAMQRFISKKAAIMVATTVIEVGVDVPNASIMVIESAERFGLAQLHQLRGRVGRGSEQSFCILLTSYKLSSESRKRINVITSTNDGFIIAEEDLKIRGYGDIDGTRQSGLPFELKIAGVSRDHAILEYARKVANELIEEDPLLEQPQNQKLKQFMQYKLKESTFWGMIS
ncbi:MAG: ATP-dependent DNA helicase RecG [Salinivirgaceae bacterium]|nr:ATP-dependent DNA helicase RecG [Bacteroidales bacterium]